MEALVLYFSYHHKNTEKVASVIAKTLKAELKTPSEIEPARLKRYELIGFGSGIYFGKHHKTLLDFADELPPVVNKKAFIFSSSGQEGRGEKFHQPLRKRLQAKGYVVIGEFNCPGYDTYALTKLVGGIKKGHPNEEDLHNAQTFAQSMA